VEAIHNIGGVVEKGRAFNSWEDNPYPDEAIEIAAWQIYVRIYFSIYFATQTSV
jgi:hypothetical protein